MSIITTTTGGSGYYISNVGDTPIPPKSVPCPKCDGRAIRGFDGHDITLEMRDHEADPRDKDRYVQNGDKAKLRICAGCGHVWATLVRVVEG